MKLDYIECRPDWVATFRCLRTDKLVCLMRTPRGHWYWRYPEYEGLFPWGATGPCDLNLLHDALSRRVLTPVACRPGSLEA